MGLFLRSSGVSTPICPPSRASLARVATRALTPLPELGTVPRHIMTMSQACG